MNTQELRKIGKGAQLIFGLHIDRSTLLPDRAMSYLANLHRRPVYSMIGLGGFKNGDQNAPLYTYKIIEIIVISGVPHETSEVYTSPLGKYI